jgi:hypothetical protein
VTILARNPVHSVLWLILAFFNAAGLMILIGAEFIAMLLVIVYVGAVAVLFLFVVMMLDIDFAQLAPGSSRTSRSALRWLSCSWPNWSWAWAPTRPAAWCSARPTRRPRRSRPVEHRRDRGAALFALSLPV